MLMLMSAKSVDLDGVSSHSRLSFSPSNAFAGLRINSDGTIDGTEATSLNWAIDDGTWLLIGANSDYEVRFTQNSGDVPFGTLNTWQALTTTRAISYQLTGIGSQGGNFTVEIRQATTQAVLATATFTLSVTVE